MNQTHIPIDTIVVNSKIYSVDNQFRQFEAIAIDKGKILELGTTKHLKKRYAAKELIDGKGRYVYPGLIDAHCHLLRYAKQLKELDLFGANSMDEVIDRTKQYAAANPNLKAIVGRGWNQNLWIPPEMPDNLKLNKEFPNIPVVLTRIDLHAAIANSAALQQAGLIENPNSIDGGIVVLKNGFPTGLLIDNAIQKVVETLPELSDDEFIRLLMKAQKNCLAVGLTTIGDALVMPDEMRLLLNMETNNQLALRINAMMLATESNIEKYSKKGIQLYSKLTFRTFKFFADGALGSRGAWLQEPYSDDPENVGIPMLNEELFITQLNKIKSCGFQVATHAIGDAANQFVLKCYSQVLTPGNNLRWRLEHAQIMPTQYLSIIRDYKVIPSVQPTHATSDMYWVKDRIGNRLKNAYNFRQLLRHGGLLAMGSDFPVEDINPLLGFYAAISMKDLNGFPNGGFKPEETITRKEALKAMTIWAAYAQFSENSLGSLEVGKQADLCMLTSDLMNIPENEVPNTEVLLTMVNGVIEHRII
ncbi:MAG: amidohydrolase [Sphingobacteriales bacterium]|nr:MAG: amidohydrolase [Sphingobacteriales bacterium]